MKDYKKPSMIAKNLPTGSYAAGCPSKGTGGCMLIMESNTKCKKCDRAV